VTLFSRFRSQPSGNIGSKYSDCYFTMRTGESKTSSTDALPTHYVSAGVELRAPRSWNATGPALP